MAVIGESATFTTKAKFRWVQPDVPNQRIGRFNKSCRAAIGLGYGRLDLRVRQEKLTMNRSLLVRMFGFPATLIHGDTLVLDRWLWLAEYLPRVANGSKKLLDVGCGTGAFTIGAARRGYRSLGLSWDERDQKMAVERALICKADLAEFNIQDVRNLDERLDLQERFDVVVCCENIEHILDDQKLIVDITRCLNPGGVFLLSTPNFHYKPITKSDNGPFSATEDGGHVRRGYTPENLRGLCASAGLKIDRIEYCSGFCSQKVTALLRTVTTIQPILAWALVLPLRLLPPLLDPVISKLSGWPGFSITLVAIKT